MITRPLTTFCQKELTPRMVSPLRIVVTISPLAHNWSVKFLSHLLYPDLAAFESELVSGKLAERIEELRATLKRGGG